MATSSSSSSLLTRICRRSAVGRKPKPLAKAKLELRVKLPLEKLRVKPPLEKLKLELARYVDNSVKVPIYYDDTWKGLVSRAGLTEGDPGSDFGNSFYNDHHFHYGYFIYTAAVVATRLQRGRTLRLPVPARNAVTARPLPHKRA